MLERAHKAAWIALFACFAVGFGFVVWSASQQSPPHNREQPRSADNLKSPIPNALTKTEADQNKEDGKKGKTWYSYFTDHAPEWLVALFTGTLWWSTRRLWRVTNATLKHAEKTAERQLRAYVIVEGAIKTKNPGGKGFGVAVDTKNFGDTPAYDLFQWSKIEIRERPLQSRLPIHCAASQNRAILGPKASTISMPSFTRDLTADEIEAIQRGKKAIYVHGEISYRDAFNRWQYTTFRFQCSEQGFALGAFKAEGEGNEAT
jgi:hypothetical protein